MMASGHMATGALLTGLAGPLLPSPLNPPAAVALSMLAGAYLALVMDLDTRGKCYHLLVPFSWLLRPLLVGVAKLLYHLTRGDDDPEQTNGHRMFTHQPAFAGLLALIALWATWGTEWTWYATGVVFVGVWAHRPGDACTKHGVPVGLVRVLVRFFSGESRVWITVGAPRWFRFVTGGKSGKRMFKAKSSRLWDMIGEGVVTGVLTGLCVLLGLLTVAGWYPLVLS
jgi:LexA-binding, inner membrane-associated putative hydrolase